MGSLVLDLFRMADFMLSPVTGKNEQLQLSEYREQLQDTYIPPADSAERRSYDLYITYSKYYQVPQFWLVGFSVDKTPLSMKQVLARITPPLLQRYSSSDPSSVYVMAAGGSRHQCGSHAYHCHSGSISAH